ncbi:MAG TPA: (deoxy)nucleoside triphosphate pyrophosphohydrolase [Actinopolymorphaceae bacterium]
MTSATVIVGTAIVRADRVLAQQRARPRELAGKWELPGGRVEPGESEREAVVRECEEELGVRVEVGERVGPDICMPHGPLLRVYAATLTSGDVEPRAVEHRAVRWVGVAELDALDWIEADRVLVPHLRALL